MKTKYSTIILLFSILFSSSVQAQQTYKLNASKPNVVKVQGTSNVHNWTMSATDPVSEAEFGKIGDNGVPASLSVLNFTVNAKSLKSESASMNTRTYKTMKADAFPKITFKMSKAEIVPSQKNKFNIKTTGILTIAGVAKTIAMTVAGEVNADNTITCSGTEKILLTDYGIQPPSFMLGAMKVGNELTVQFTLNFKK